jgi:hypothetical protein
MPQGARLNAHREQLSSTACSSTNNIQAHKSLDEISEFFEAEPYPMPRWRKTSMAAIRAAIHRHPQSSLGSSQSSELHSSGPPSTESYSAVADDPAAAAVADNPPQTRVQAPYYLIVVARHDN